MLFEPNARLTDQAPVWAVPFSLTLVGGLVLATVYIAEYGFGLAPCTLCLWQRYPYMAMIALGLAGTGFCRQPAIRRASVVLGGLVGLIGAGIAGFHVGVEQGWWAGLSSCSAPVIEKGMSVEDLKAVLQARQDVVPCDEPAWTLFGVSMAGYNLILATLLGAGYMIAALRGRA